MSGPPSVVLDIAYQRLYAVDYALGFLASGRLRQSPGMAGHEDMQMLNIELLLHSRLIKDGISLLLTNAGFCVLDKSDQDYDQKIVLIDFGDCKDPGVTLVHQQRAAKIVVLVSEAESLALSPDETGPLSGVLTYDLSADVFVRSLHLICSGERVFSQNLARQHAGPAPPSGASPWLTGVHLSPRERQVLLDLVEGHSNKAIARNLGVTEATAKVHLKSVFRKIRVDNRTQAAIWALANLPELNANASPRGHF
jgi:two-component system, NarL family, nitrate/nitrite response regulator NarL